MSFPMMLILALLTAAIQVEMLPYAVAPALVYVGFLFTPFVQASWIAMIAGIGVDVFRAGGLGVSSVLYLLVIGLMKLVVSPRQESGRRTIGQDLVAYLPIAVLDMIISGGGFGRFVGDMVVIIVIYGLISFFSLKTDAITVRRNL